MINKKHKKQLKRNRIKAMRLKTYGTTSIASIERGKAIFAAIQKHKKAKKQKMLEQMGEAKITKPGLISKIKRLFVKV